MTIYIKTVLFNTAAITNDRITRNVHYWDTLEILRYCCKNDLIKSVIILKYVRFSFSAVDKITIVIKKKNIYLFCLKSNVIGQLGEPKKILYG